MKYALGNNRSAVRSALVLQSQNAGLRLAHNRRLRYVVGVFGENDRAVSMKPTEMGFAVPKNDLAEAPGPVAHSTQPTDYTSGRRLLIEHIARKTKRTQADDFALGLNATLIEMEQRLPRQARVAELKYFGRFSDAAIARRIERTENTVRKDIRLARAYLMRALKMGEVPLELAAERSDGE